MRRIEQTLQRNEDNMKKEIGKHRKSLRDGMQALDHGVSNLTVTVAEGFKENNHGNSAQRLRILITIRACKKEQDDNNNYTRT